MIFLDNWLIMIIKKCRSPNKDAAFAPNICTVGSRYLSTII